MKKQTYRIARHCRLGGVGTEVQLSEDEAIQLTNETPGALEPIDPSVGNPDQDRIQGESRSGVKPTTKKDNEAV